MAIRRRRKKKRPAWRPPELSEPQIKEWVAEWLADHGTYPKVLSGKIPGTAWGETWHRVDAALRYHGRGLTRKSSLADFTCRHFGRRHPTNPPPVSEARLCEWVRTWQQRTGRYPQSFDGAIPSSGGETWFGIILAWADLHFEKTGRWPTRVDGPVSDVPTETWLGIDAALHLGSRSLPPGLSLFRLLRRERGAKRQSRRASN